MANERASLSINAWNAEYVDGLYEQWLADPRSVAEQWDHFFRGFDLGQAPGAEQSTAAACIEQGRVDALIYHYRDIGHFAADLDPLGTRRPYPENLELATYGLSDAVLDDKFDTGTLPLESPSPLRSILDVLAATYCGHIGVEYMHIQERSRRRWLQDRMEPVRNTPSFDKQQKLRILNELVEAETLESFLNVRYRGKKRFSLEGGESLNPMLNEIVDLGPSMNIKEITIGMAHRGRLNVLVNVLEKTYDQLFTEFEEAWVEDFTEGAGDVKYHRGYSSDKVTSSGDVVRLTLSPNPSHLEFANPAVIGRARAKQRIRRDTQREQCVPVLIHGDAAFPGQGIVAETFNMASLDGYTVGGSIHIILNNQVGFTTNPRDAHSGNYCTDVAKMVEAPIFHVNGDDPEACVFVALLALQYRQTFKSDVVIDMWSYRKFGHNEGDEPMFTQPLLYRRIKDQESVLSKYMTQLVNEGHLTPAEFTSMEAELKERLDKAQSRSKEQPVASTVSAFQSVWAGLTEQYNDDPVETGVSRETLQTVAAGLGSVPEDFNLHRKLTKLFDARRTVVEADNNFDWGMGELFAYGTLLLEGYPVRLTGQDVERGTFSHRHAVVFDQQDGTSYEPLNNLGGEQAKFCVHNSPLTESACLSFEYGYSLGDPNMLVIWEAQFGDFANGAQVIFDQFIASAEAKWKRCTGLTVFLPHGYEGAGPEHSSARLERFLALCARNNMQVVYPTTPAQHFHLIRRQMKRNFRKPLIVMTPKSLLRHPKAVSPLEQFVNGRFEHVIDDPGIEDPGKVRRVALCSGKIYYDFLAHREKVGCDDVAFVRLEQIYPLRTEAIGRVLDRYGDAEIVWAQEEPENMGAWRFIEDRLREEMNLSLRYIGRPENASPAVASEKMHKREQEKIMEETVGCNEKSKNKAEQAA